MDHAVAVRSAPLQPETRFRAAPGDGAGAWLVGLLLAGVLISNTTFWVFAVLGVKVQAQVLIYSALVLLIGVPILQRVSAYQWRPIFWLALVLAISSTLWRRGMIETGNAWLGAIVVSGIYAIGEKGREAASRWIVTVACLFAVLGAAQFFLLIAYPEWIPEVVRDYFEERYLAHEPIPVTPIMLLGMATGESYDFLGVPFTRVSSFVKEPSMIIVYFMVPGLIAYLRNWRKAAATLLGFSVLTLSGTLLLCAAFAAGSWPVLWFLRKRRFLAAFFLPSFIVVAAIGGLSVIGSREIVSLTTTFMRPLVETANFLDKETSLNVRLSGMENDLASMVSAPFGVAEPGNRIAGLFIFAWMQAGVFGALVATAFLVTALLTILPLCHHPRYWWVGLACYGTFIQAMSFNQSLFLEVPGLLTNALLLCEINRATTPEQIETHS